MLFNRGSVAISGIGEEIRLHATTQRTKGGSLISQSRVGLRNLVHAFRITHSTIRDLASRPCKISSPSMDPEAGEALRIHGVSAGVGHSRAADRRSALAAK